MFNCQIFNSICYYFYKKITFSLISKVLLCLLAISVVAILIQIYSIPNTSRVPYIPTKTIDVSFDIKVDNAQYVNLRYITKVNNIFNNNGKNKIISEDVAYATNNYYSVNKLLSVNDDFGNLIIEIECPFKATNVNVKNLIIGNYKINEFKLIVSEDNQLVQHIIIDTLKIGKAISYSSLSDSKLKLLFYRFVYWCQKNSSALYQFTLFALTLLCCINFKCRSLLIFYVFVLYTYITFMFMWKQTVFTLDSVYDGDYFRSIYKIVKTQYLPALFILSSILIACNLKIFWLKLPFFVISLIIILLFVSDVFTFTEFGCHLAISDVFSFGKDATASLTVIKHFVTEYNQLFILCLCLVIVVFFLSALISKNRQPFSHYSLILIPILFILNSYSPSAALSLHEDRFENVLTSGAQRIRAERKYTQIDAIRNQPIIEVNGLNKRKNVIVIFTESLSANESRYFGGINNNTLNLDAVASKNVAFKNYYSNGYNTDKGNYAFLTSTPLLHGTQAETKDNVYLPSQIHTGSFLNYFKKEGYTTNCLYSAISIGELENIWRRSGFDNFYDGNDPYYKNEERLSFNSVPDKAMFKRTLELIPQWNKKGNFFTFIMTTTTHGPYVIPKTHEFNFHKAIKYFDSSFAYFYKELLKQGFFKNGMLVVTGDHRAMVPYTNEELEKYGLKGFAKVPLLIVGSELPRGLYTEQLSHVSLGPLLEYINLKKAYHYEFEYLPFASIEPTDNNFILYQRHAPQDEVIVIDKDGKEHIVKLNGDDTNFDRSDIESSFRTKVLNTIKWLRQ